MFIDERTQNRLHAVPGESISHGTMRTQDLIPAFLDVIRDTPEYVQVMNAIPAMPWRTKKQTGGTAMTRRDCWNRCSTRSIVTHRRGYYFGAHLGDGSDYGFWKMDK